MKITVEARVAAPIDDVWLAWTTPDDITEWNAASDDWTCPRAELDLRSGGRFAYRMEAKDGSTGFDFVGTFTSVVSREAIEFTLDDGRSVAVRFLARDDAVIVREAFDAASASTAERERHGWQAILDNFARYVQGKTTSDSNPASGGSRQPPAWRTAADPGREPPASVAMRSAMHTDRLRLRRAAEADLEAYCRTTLCDANVMAMLPGHEALTLETALPRARATLIETWREHGFGPWLVSERSSEAILGHCGLRYWPGTEDVEVLYALTPHVWGLGYATEAARTSVAEGFTFLGLRRIIAAAFPENLASIRVMTQLGLRYWKRGDLRGERVDMYQLDRRSWRTGQPVAAAALDR